MQQLPPLDSVFLSMETPEAPGHIGGVALLDPSTHPEASFDYEQLVEFVAERLALCPRFSWKLQQVPFGLDEPYWVEDESLDFRRHIHHLALPAPGGSMELSNTVAYLFERPLDRSRPLWEMFLIEGLQGGRSALLWKIHHSLMDGESGAGLVELLFDLAPEPADQPLVPVSDSASAGERPGFFAMTARTLGNARRRPAAMLRHLVGAGTEAVQQIAADGMEAMSAAPRASFNGVLSSKRSVAWSRISLERVKELKSELDVTVNDVVLALTGDAVRRYLEARDELPNESLIAAIPVSVRREGDKSLGNQLSEIGITWGTDVEDPLERIFTINHASTQAKASAKAQRVNPVAAVAESLPPGLLNMLSKLGAAAADRLPLPQNAVVSNVRMSPVPLFIAGARIEGMLPLSVLPPTQGLNITVVTYLDEMHFGLVGDPNLVENLWEIADAIPKALMRLEEAAGADPRFCS